MKDYDQVYRLQPEGDYCRTAESMCEMRIGDVVRINDTGPFMRFDNRSVATGEGKWTPMELAPDQLRFENISSWDIPKSPSHIYVAVLYGTSKAGRDYDHFVFRKFFLPEDYRCYDAGWYYLNFVSLTCYMACTVAFEDFKLPVGEVLVDQKEYEAEKERRYEQWCEESTSRALDALDRSGLLP